MFDKNMYGKIKEFVSIFILIALGTLAGVTAGSYLNPNSSATDSSYESSDYDENCNVLGIEIRGCLLTYEPDVNDSSDTSDSYCDTVTSSEDVIWALEEAANNPQIKAVVLEIDSGGGSPVAADEIASAVKNFGKPSIAWVRENAYSAAYWIASAADTVIASENSDVGSIGVTMSYLDNVKKNAKDGLTFNQLSTGKYKDTGTPDRPLTDDERSLIQRDLDIVLQNFINAVAANRDLSLEKVTALADGSTMLGAMALQNGLVDQIGTKAEVWQKLEADMGETPDVCWP
ncbi:MAG: signal peptide peptidase SppA [Candidatus Paceibacterota bacterium]|jgi:signal peptide peptidase SppA